MANWRSACVHSKEWPVNKQQNYLGLVFRCFNIAEAEDVIRSEKRNILVTGNYFLYYSFPDTGGTWLTDRSLILTWTKPEKRIQGRARTYTAGCQTRWYWSLSFHLCYLGLSFHLCFVWFSPVLEGLILEQLIPICNYNKQFVQPSKPTKLVCFFFPPQIGRISRCWSRKCFFCDWSETPLLWKT